MCVIIFSFQQSWSFMKNIFSAEWQLTNNNLQVPVASSQHTCTCHELGLFFSFFSSI